MLNLDAETESLIIEIISNTYNEGKSNREKCKDIFKRG